MASDLCPHRKFGNSFVCVEVLRPSQPSGVMSSAVSLPNHTFTGQTKSSKRLTSIVHILSPETDNCPSWISGRERMTVENISWSISTKECCRPRGGGGLNPRPPGLQSDGASNWATEAGNSFSSLNPYGIRHKRYTEIAVVKLTIKLFFFFYLFVNDSKLYACVHACIHLHTYIHAYIYI